MPALKVMCRWLALLLALLLGLGASAAPADLQRLDRALLQSDRGEHPVTLPHVLQTGDFHPEGGRVRYRIDLHLPAVPHEPLGIYVRKLSLSGRLSLNGSDIGGCELGPLETLRCLHQPYLFTPPIGLWRAGHNTLEFEIYATGRQMNGLSAVLVGSAHALDHGPYLLHRLLQVESLQALSWVNLCLGMLTLAVALVLRDDRTYLYFGLTCITNALSNLNMLVTSPMVPIELFNGFVFSVRLVSVPLMFLTLLAFFQRLDKRFERALLAYAVVIPCAIWLSGNSRGIALALYLPLILAGVVLFPAMLRWSILARPSIRSRQVAVTLTYALLLPSGVVDVLRLGGQTAFEGVYLVNYVSAGINLLFAGMLLARLAGALRAERRLTARLDQEVAQHRAALHFLSQMSHELRSPLTTMLGHLRLMARTELPTAVIAGVRSIWQDASQLLTMIDEILTYAQGNAGKLRLQPQPQAWPDLAQRLQQTAQALTQNTSNRLLCELRGPEDAVLMLDEQRLQQILRNLLGNAARYTRDGDITLRCELQPAGNAAAPAWQLQCEVRDTGPGIPAHDQERIFKPFERGDDARLSDHKGIGMGLAVARQLVQAMGGKLLLVSEVGHGSSFSFTLVCDAAQADDLETHEWDRVLAPTRRAQAVQDAAASPFAERRLIQRPPPAQLLALQALIGNGQISDALDCVRALAQQQAEFQPFSTAVSQALLQLDFEALHALCEAQRRNTDHRIDAMQATPAEPEL